MLTLLAGVAVFERELIVERTVAGIETARKRGVQLGRRPRVFRRDEVQGCAPRASHGGHLDRAGRADGHVQGCSRTAGRCAVTINVRLIG